MNHNEDPYYDMDDVRLYIDGNIEGNNIWDEKNNNLWKNYFRPNYYESYHRFDIKPTCNPLFTQMKDYSSPLCFDYSKNLNNIKTFMRDQNTTKHNDENMLEKLLCVDIVKVKNIDIYGKKVISISLFDRNMEAGFKEDPNSKGKGIVEYIKCLRDAVPAYLSLFPDWIVRIYTDTSITASTRPVVKKFLKDMKTVKAVEIFEVCMPRLKVKKKFNHVGLLSVLFRYLVLFDPTVETCFMADADNYPTIGLQIFINKWISSNKPFFAFLNSLPNIYSRVNKDGNCVVTIFAGMFGCKKKTGKIINPLIWENIFTYIDEYYGKFLKGEIQYKKEQCEYMYGSKGDDPFKFGFEEVAITNVLIPAIIECKLDIYAVPLTYHTLLMYDIYLDENIDLLTPEFLDVIKRNLRMQDFKKDKLPPHFVTIIYSILYNHVNKQNNKLKISDNTYIDIFKGTLSEGNLKHIQKTLLIGFDQIYPGHDLYLNISEINKIIDQIESGQQVDEKLLKPSEKVKHAGCRKREKSDVRTKTMNGKEYYCKPCTKEKYEEFMKKPKDKRDNLKIKYVKRNGSFYQLRMIVF